MSYNKVPLQSSGFGCRMYVKFTRLSNFSKEMSELIVQRISPIVSVFLVESRISRRGDAVHEEE